VAVTVFPGEIHQAPRSWTANTYHNLVYFNVADNGGHFAAWEQPENGVQVASLTKAWLGYCLDRNASGIKLGVFAMARPDR